MLFIVTVFAVHFKQNLVEASIVNFSGWKKVKLSQYGIIWSNLYGKAYGFMKIYIPGIWEAWHAVKSLNLLSFMIMEKALE